MAPARSARTPARTPSARPRPRPRALPGGGRAIRWDRISRVALLVVLVGLLGLYVGPARSYWSTVQEAKERRAEVTLLQRQNERLRARRAALRDASTLEREARRMGMVRPRERAYVLEHLPKGP
jgi:cell division protein FtsB